MSEILIVIDTETTSINPMAARVLEIGAVVTVDDIPIDVFSSLCYASPSELVQAVEALKVNQLDVKEIELAPKRAVVREQFRGFLEQYPRARLTAYNINYDRNVLQSGKWPVDEYEWAECIMLAASSVLHKMGVLETRNGRPAWCSLIKACEFFKIERRGAHRALMDAIDAMKVWHAIKRWREAEVARLAKESVDTV